MRIFLAEDNEDNFLVIQSNLKKVQSAVELVWAKDGKDAIEKLENEQDFSIFLIDIEMPFIGGLELVQWIKSQPKFINIPTVAITASVFAEMKKSYAQSGFDYILEKPFKRKEFLDLLQEAINPK